MLLFAYQWLIYMLHVLVTSGVHPISYLTYYLYLHKLHLIEQKKF